MRLYLQNMTDKKFVSRLNKEQLQSARRKKKRDVPKMKQLWPEEKAPAEVWMTPRHARKLFSAAQPLRHVRLFATPQTAAPQASLSITNSRSLRKLTSIELVMPSNHLILCRPLLLPPSVFPNTSHYKLQDWVIGQT